jgi:integrase
MGIMDVPLPGINTVTKKLADGTVVTYIYAWKGGPRVLGKPGSPEFFASLHEANKSRQSKPAKVVLDLLNQYTSSRHFDNKLKERTTQASRLRLVRRIKREKDPIGELPVSSLSDPRTMEILLTWRENMATETPAMAQFYWATLSASLTWAVKQKIIKSNPCLGAERIYYGSRVDKIWSEEQIAKFCDEAPSYLVIAFMIALWTGQREGSLVRLRWSAYDGRRLWVEQDKGRRNQTPKVVCIPVVGAFKEFLDRLESEAGVGLTKEERDQRYILQNFFGRPWASAESFGSRFSVINSKIVEGRTFHDLRGTAVTRLARAECTVPQIATITGHSLETVQDILDKHYLHRDIVLAEQAMEKRNRYETSQLTTQLLEKV